MPIWLKCWTIWGFYSPQNKSVFRPINIQSENLTAFDWSLTADESSGSLRLFRPWLKKKNLMRYYFALKTRLRISDQKFQNFAECIAGKGQFASASCAKNYMDRSIHSAKSIGTSSQFLINSNSPQNCPFSFFKKLINSPYGDLWVKKNWVLASPNIWKCQFFSPQIPQTCLVWLTNSEMRKMLVHHLPQLQKIKR